MSDAMSDMARANREADLQTAYLRAITEYLKESTPENLERVTASAQSADSIIAWGRYPERVQGLEDRLQRLKDGDKDTWARLLSAASKEDSPGVFRSLKELSPFAGQLFLIIDYGRGFVNFGGEINALMNTFIQNKGWKMGDCDSYAVVLPSAPTPTDVLWLECGIIGVKGPRPAK